MIGIDDLLQVFKALRDLVHWQFLGLELGIHYRQLTYIMHRNKGIIHNCKRDMLTLWLRRDHNVIMVAPSWLFLKEALRKIGENELADTIQTDGESGCLRMSHMHDAHVLLEKRESHCLCAVYIISSGIIHCICMHVYSVYSSMLSYNSQYT